MEIDRLSNWALILAVVIGYFYCKGEKINV